MASNFNWSLPFLANTEQAKSDRKTALIILNQPFSVPLLRQLWHACKWRCCADGGANRLHDALISDAKKVVGQSEDVRERYIPNLIKGDLDSLRQDVREYYSSQKVDIVQDHDQDSTDLMKCIASLSEIERQEGGDQYDIIILGGLSGRLDQTIHTLSYLHKLRKKRKRVFAVNDENVAWVLDEGEHHISVDHDAFGPTCGLLPVGIDSTKLTTRGLRWNLTDCDSHFDGMVSTSNHLVPSEGIVECKQAS
ncbi:Thiamine pyrophosphokinase [Abortiporus biennis]